MLSHKSLRQKLARRFLTLGVFFLSSLMATTAPASETSTQTEPLFADFTTPDGAMTVYAHGDYVEPYTALIALLAAHRLGADVYTQAHAFAYWLLPYQQTDGRFSRICQKNGTEWQTCGPADADDSLAAFWCLAVTELLKDDTMLTGSCAASLRNLATLWDERRVTFHALTGQTAAYFADNVEVASALIRMRANPAIAKKFAQELSKLPSNKQMLEGLAHNYDFDFTGPLEPKKASLPPTPYAFYPYAVAPIYPWVFGLSTGPLARRNWAVWKYRYGDDWLAGKSDDFPWGLIAWAAYKLGDKETAAAWLRASTQWRNQGRWYLLEEGVRIGLLHAMPDAVNQGD
jgi:hypothetical protein